MSSKYNIYRFILLKNSEVHKDGKIFLISKGSLWRYDSAPSLDSNIISVEDASIKIKYNPESIERLNKTSYLLLLAINSCCQRFYTYRNRKALLQQGMLIHQWFKKVSNDDENLTLIRIKVALGNFPYADLKYIGKVSGLQGMWFGVELNEEDEEICNTSGFHMGRLLFACKVNCGVLIAVNQIDEIYELDCLDSDGQELEIFEIGERVTVFLVDNRPEEGVVRWIGHLEINPERFTYGIEFDNPVGKGTGKYKGKTLYRTKPLHAGLFPVTALLKTKAVKEKKLKNLSKKCSLFSKQASDDPMNVYNTYHCSTTLHNSQNRHNVINYFTNANLLNNSLDYQSQQDMHYELQSFESTDPKPLKLHFQSPLINSKTPLLKKKQVIFTESMLPVEPIPAYKTLYELNELVTEQKHVSLSNISFPDASSFQSTTHFCHYKPSTNMVDYFQQKQRHSTLDHSSQHKYPSRTISSKVMTETHEETYSGSDCTDVGEEDSQQDINKSFVIDYNDDEERTFSISDEENNILCEKEEKFENSKIFSKNPNNVDYSKELITDSKKEVINLPDTYKKTQKSKVYECEGGVEVCLNAENLVDLSHLLNNITHQQTSKPFPIRHYITPAYETGSCLGIQGLNNSCYLDTLLFSMFAFNPSFDAMLQRPKTSSDVPDYQDILTILLQDIINPLRSKLFVHATSVLRLKEHIQQNTTQAGYIDEKKDPEELFLCLFRDILMVPPFITYNTCLKEYLFQLVSYSIPDISIPTTFQLLSHSMQTFDIKFAYSPDNLILQIPRYGMEKVFKIIFPSPYINIKDIISDTYQTVEGKNSDENNKNKKNIKSFNKMLKVNEQVEATEDTSEIFYEKVKKTKLKTTIIKNLRNFFRPALKKPATTQTLSCGSTFSSSSTSSNEKETYKVEKKQSFKNKDQKKDDNVFHDYHPNQGEDLLESWTKKMSVKKTSGQNSFKNKFQNVSFRQRVEKRHLNEKSKSYSPTISTLKNTYSTDYISSLTLVTSKFSNASREELSTVEEDSACWMELYSVICIDRSHYVSFVKAGVSEEAPWLMFDSMAGREDEEEVYNIPKVKQCPGISEFLSEKSKFKIADSFDCQNLSKELERLLHDPYICFYRKISQ